jgi:hypothetical protein
VVGEWGIGEGSHTHRPITVENAVNVPSVDGALLRLTIENHELPYHPPAQRPRSDVNVL